MPTGGGSNNEAAQARADEQARQARIKQGSNRINSIFDGAFKPSGGPISLADAVGGKSYFTADGQKVDVGAGESALDAYARKALTDFGGNTGDANQMAITKNNVLAAGHTLFDGGTRSGGFDDNFFKGRRQAYIDYATPQLEDQFGDAKKQLTFSLSRSGLLDSSTRAQKNGELSKMYDTNKQKIADDALSYETQARNSVEDARSNLIATLNATGDAEGAANSALARSTALSQGPSYSPLTQLFTDFTAGLGAQAAAERSYAAGGTKPRYETGLFGVPKGAVRNT